jgi:hypothetical protein
MAMDCSWLDFNINLGGGVKNEGLSLVDTDQGIKCSLLYMVMIKSVILDL